MFFFSFPDTAHKSILNVLRWSIKRMYSIFTRKGRSNCTCKLSILFKCCLTCAYSPLPKIEPSIEEVLELLNLRCMDPNECQQAIPV